jgi:hypothetical protein
MPRQGRNHGRPTFPNWRSGRYGTAATRLRAFAGDCERLGAAPELARIDSLMKEAPSVILIG